MMTESLMMPGQARKLKWDWHAYFGYLNKCMICGKREKCQDMLRNKGRTWADSRGYAHASCIDAGRRDGKTSYGEY